jgi:hypothetical protein
MRCPGLVEPDRTAGPARSAARLIRRHGSRVRPVRRALFGNPRVLSRQPEHQIPNLLAHPTAAGLARIRPGALDQTAVPGQQRARGDQPMRTQHHLSTHRQQPGQPCQDGPVGPVHLRAGDLTPQHRHLMTDHHDLRVLRRLATRQQHQPSEDPDHDQIQETKRHEPGSCPNPTIHPNRRSTPLRRDLERYRPPCSGFAAYRAELIHFGDLRGISHHRAPSRAGHHAGR